MDWGLFVLAVALIALLQFAVWRRLQNGEVDATDATDPMVPSDAAPPPETPLQRDHDDPNVTLCPSCGAKNESGYRFCRRCVESLYL